MKLVEFRTRKGSMTGVLIDRFPGHVVLVTADGTVHVPLDMIIRIFEAESPGFVPRFSG